MVDTVRTLAALQTLLADNVAGDISAQDVRDMLVSTFIGPSGQLLGDDWTAFAATLDASVTAPTIGNGTLTAAYRRLGSSVEVVFRWLFGSTSAAGSGGYRIKGLPYSVATDSHLGASFLTDAGTGILDGHTRAISSDDSIRAYINNSGTNFAAEVSHSYPVTWATSDELRGAISYETDFA